jgi:hypothetical protein
VLDKVSSELIRAGKAALTPLGDVDAIVKFNHMSHVLGLNGTIELKGEKGIASFTVGRRILLDCAG